MTETAKPAKAAPGNRAKVDAALVGAQHDASLALEAQHDEKVARQNAAFADLGKRSAVGNVAKDLGVTVK